LPVILFEYIAGYPGYHWVAGITAAITALDIYIYIYMMRSMIAPHGLSSGVA
jgi:hypothetical protein